MNQDRAIIRNTTRLSTGTFPCPGSVCIRLGALIVIDNINAIDTT